MGHYRTDWDNRVQEIVNHYRDGGVGSRRFLEQAQTILNDWRHFDQKARWDAMSPQEQNEYMEGYAETEFLVGRRRY